MKLRLFFSALLLLAASAVSAQLEQGNVYRIKNRGSGSYVTENSATHKVMHAQLNETDFMQMWSVVEEDGAFSFVNLLTERAMAPGGEAGAAFRTLGNASHPFTLEAVEGAAGSYMMLSSLNGTLYAGCASDGTVVSAGSSAAAEWCFEAVEVDDAGLAAARTSYYDYSGLTKNKDRYYYEFVTLFKDAVCSELKDEYMAMSDERFAELLNGFPQPLVDVALKVKNNEWVEYEKEFRVATYEPYSSAYDWGLILKANPYSVVNAPTGITCRNGDVLLVFVEDDVMYPSTLMLDQLGPDEGYSSGNTYLYKGLNVVTASKDCSLFINYEVETGRDAGSPTLADYASLGIHIVGGTLNGYFDKSRHTNEDWVRMRQTIMKNELVNVKGEHAMFHMNLGYVASACPNNIYESIDWWDTIVEWQKELIGVTKYADRWNNLMLCRDGEGRYMFATNFYTYFEYSTLKDVLPWERVRENPGYAWGPAHEIGHMNQGAINIVSCTEVSNNLMANMVVWKLGKTTSRGHAPATCYTDWLNKVPFPKRGEVFSKTRMYWQMYLYFHVAGHDTTFYPRLFEYLRETPLSTTSGVNAKFNQLRFAEACCEVAQMDLSEFFEVWGFFEPMDNVHIGDYGDYYVTLYKDDAEASRERMQQYSKKGGHLMFIEDRVKPSKRADGVDGNRLDLNSEVPVGSAGDVGQWEEYLDHSVKAHGYYYKKVNNTVAIVKDEDAGGALGFKVYDSNGKLIGVSNTYSIRIPLNSIGDVRVVAAQADGTDFEIPNVADSDSEEHQLEHLGAVLAEASKMMSIKTTTGREIGYFYADALVNLQNLYNSAKAAADNQDTSVRSYKEWAALLNAEIQRLRSDLSARAYFKELDVYVMSNYNEKAYQLCHDENGLKADKQNQTVVTSPKKRWMVESTGELHHYYLKNKGGLYLDQYDVNTSISCNGTDKSSAVVIKANYHDAGRVYFTTEAADGSELYLTLSSDYKVVFTTELLDASLWQVIRVEANNTGIGAVEVEKAGKEIIFDLTGRRIEVITVPGIYIINGEKVLVK